jgi:hypothetical protein
MGSSYVLDGRDSDLKKHVGHKIEVTGTTDSSVSGAGNQAAGRTSTGGTTGTTATAATSADHPTSGAGSSSASEHDMTGATRLHVTSVRMISADCSGTNK